MYNAAFHGNLDILKQRLHNNADVNQYGKLIWVRNEYVDEYKTICISWNSLKR